MAAPPHGRFAPSLGGVRACDLGRKLTQRSIRLGAQMTTFLITRHAGAVEWFHRKLGTAAFVHLTHLTSLQQIAAGDIVIGPLPVNIIADIVARGARYFAIDMELPPPARGPELSAEDMDRYGARPVEYRVQRVAP